MIATMTVEGHSNVENDLVQTLDMVDEVKEPEETIEEKVRKPKGHIVLKGVISSKKRDVHMHIAPRKRPAPMSNDQDNERDSLKNQGMEKGIPGGAKPPKPTVEGIMYPKTKIF